MIRIGVVGHGNRISGVIKKILREVEPDIRVVGIVDPDEEGARSRLDECDQKDVVFYKTLDEMVRKAKLDALAIGTRCNLHAPYAVKAAQYDIPLYLEKPVAVDMRQATALERAFENSKCPVVVSFPLRVSPLCVEARRQIEAGAIGKEPEHVVATNYMPYGTVYFDGGYRPYKITQGLFLQKATHDLDYLMYLMGSPVVRVAAMMTQRRVFGGDMPEGLWCSACDREDTCLEAPENRKRSTALGKTIDHPCIWGEDIGTPETGMNEDSSSALLEFEGGRHGVYTQVFFSRRRDAARRGAIVTGYMGQIRFDWYENELVRVRHHEPFTDVTKAGEGRGHFGGDEELAYDFIGIIKGKCESRTTVQMGLQSVYTCLAARQSAERGKFVKVRLVGQTS